MTLVRPYDPAWPAQFLRIAAFVEAGLDGTGHRIEHVGSTAIPGMTAKPIIDLDVVIQGGAFPAVRKRLEALGYFHQGDLGLPGREAFDLRDPAAREALPRHNLYVCEEGILELRKHLAFRDFLRLHPEWRERLGRRKEELCLRHGNDRQAYIEGKSLMVVEITGLGMGLSWAFEAEVDPGVRMRPLREEDAVELFSVVNANRAHLREWLPWLDANTAPADSLRFIQSAAESQALGHGCTCGILLEGRIAGVVDFHAVRSEGRSAEIGYWLDREACGRGIVTRCCRLLVGHGFTTCGLNRIVIRVTTGNLRSQAVPERLGFVLEGVSREAEWLYGRCVDLAVYSMLRREW